MVEQNELESTQVCKTFIEIIQSDDFNRWVGIILDNNPKYGKEYYLLLFGKIRSWEELNDEEKKDIKVFLWDYRVEKLWKEIIWRLNLTSLKLKELTSAEDMISWSDVLRELFSENWYERTKKELLKILWEKDSKQPEIKSEESILTKIIIEWKEKEIKVDKNNFKVERTDDWKLITSPNWIKVYESPTKDIWEYAEWEYKLEQLFTWNAAMRETAKQWKKMMTADYWKAIMNLMDYKKFKDKYNIKLCGYRSTFGNFNNIGNECNYWSSEFNENETRYIWFDHSNYNNYQDDKSLGFSVRCYEDCYWWLISL